MALLCILCRRPLTKARRPTATVSGLCCRAYRVFDWPHPPLQQDSILFATLMDVVSDTGDVDGSLKCAPVLPAMYMRG